MNDISKSQDKSLGILINQYKDLNTQIEVSINYKNTLKRQIIDFFELLGIERKDNVRIIEKINLKKVSVRQLKKLFNLNDNGIKDNELLDNIMIEVDIDKTIENLIYLNGLAEPMAKKVGERLKDLHETKYMELEIGKWLKT